ncbi:TPA: SHOCT domain-containing protein [Citrobacter braakii]
MNQQNSLQYKQPILAALLSFLICGVGQIYNGEVLKGIGLFVVACIFGVIFFPLALIPAILGCIEAYTTANKINERLDKEKSEYIDSTTFIDNLKKLNALLTSDIITQDEFDSKKKEMITDISMKKLKEDPLEFLAKIAPLKKNGVLTDEEVIALKSIV